MYIFSKMGCGKVWFVLEIIVILLIILVVIWYPISIVWTLIRATAAGLLYLGVLAVAFVLICKEKYVYKAFIPTVIITPYLFFSPQLQHLLENRGNFRASIFAMFITLAISIVVYLVVERKKHPIEKVDSESVSESVEEPVNYGVGDFDGHGWSIEKKK